jgi:hypothetical protein
MQMHANANKNIEKFASFLACGDAAGKMCVKAANSREAGGEEFG